MKKILIEQLERIHRLNYGNGVIKENDLWDKIIGSTGGKRETIDKKKADVVSDDLNTFYKNLEDAAKGNGITQQERGSMNFQKEVESLQIGLILLGYQLPRHGVDGYFGPETAQAVQKFTSEKLGDEGKKEVNEVALTSPIGNTSVNSPFGQRWGRMHHGVDLKASSGTPIKSPLDGQVIDAAMRSDACGGTIYVQHADGYKTRYCHCKKINVTKGQTVSKGDVLGLSGGGSGDPGRGRSDGPHLHFEVYKNGKTVNPMEHLGSEVGDFVAGSVSGGSTITASPAMLDKLIELLKEKGVKSEDITPYINKGGGKGGVITINDWEGVVNVVINNLEGGYYHPDMLKDGRIKDGRFSNSGETMYGLDRKAGNIEATGPAGKEFWSLIDAENARSNWKHNYMLKDNPSLDKKLRKLAADVMKPLFIRNSRAYLTPEAADIISKDAALTFNFAYATWNGPGWFQKFARVINDAVASGNEDPKELLKLVLARRMESGNSLISQGGSKVANIANRISSTSTMA
jgi:murein DD-endopeptidase MepM/ murein hydrolase activator NlpD